MFTYDVVITYLGVMHDELRLSATNALDACNQAYKLVLGTKFDVRYEFQARKVA